MNIFIEREYTRLLANRDILTRQIPLCYLRCDIAKVIQLEIELNIIKHELAQFKANTFIQSTEVISS